MLESLGLPAAVQALLLIGLVLVEAVALYLGYGLIEDRAAPRLFKTIKSN
jgi:hypothetical protein